MNHMTHHHTRRRERTIIGFLTGLILGLGAGASYLILVVESTIPACR